MLKPLQISNRPLPLARMAAFALMVSAAGAQVALAAPPTPTKKALIARVLKFQQAGIEGAGQVMAERPALALLDQVDAELQARVAPEKREAVSTEIQADIKKYLDEAVPLVRDRAVKLAPQTIGGVLDEKFTEDELKQLVGFLESPVYTKYQQLGIDMEKSLLEKLLADTRGVIEPKVNALDLSVSKRLGITPPAAAPKAK